MTGVQTCALPISFDDTIYAICTGKIELDDSNPDFLTKLTMDNTCSKDQNRTSENDFLLDGPTFGSLKWGDALVFDGANDKLTNSNTSLQITGNLTLSGWYNFAEAFDANDALYIQGASGETSDTNFLYSLFASDANNLKYLHESGAGSNEIITWNFDFLTSTDYYIAIVRDVNTNTEIGRASCRERV